MKQKRHKYIFICISTILFLVNFLSLNANASTNTEQHGNYSANQLLDTIPEEYKDSIPKAQENETVTDYASRIDFSSLTGLVTSTVKKCVEPTTQNLLSLISIVILSSLLNNTNNALASNSFKKTTEYITRLFITFWVYNSLSSTIKTATLFIKNITTIINGFIPVIYTLLTSGGNLSSAITTSATLSLILTAVSNIFYFLLIPTTNICFGMSLAGACSDLNGLQEISKIAKYIFTIILTSTMTLLSIFLIFKTHIAAATDNAMIRTIRFAGSFVPIVGSALGESVRGIMAGINIIKSSVGFIGIFIILITTLPAVISILLNKLSIAISSAVSSILGCEKESKLLNEFSGILNLTLSIVICTSIVLLLELTTFVLISPAFGGN